MYFILLSMPGSPKKLYLKLILGTICLIDILPFDPLINVYFVFLCNCYSLVVSIKCIETELKLKSVFKDDYIRLASFNLFILVPLLPSKYNRWNFPLLFFFLCLFWLSEFPSYLFLILLRKIHISHTLCNVVHQM